MVKTKRKQLAALAALKVTSPESSRKPTEEHQDQDGLQPALNEGPIDKSSGSLEIRQQRIIFWIPPLDPSPRLVNSRSFRISGTPSRKRKLLSSVNEEEKTSSDAEDGHVYKKYAKIILKLDSWNSKKTVDAPPPLDVPPLDAPPVYAEKAYQRRKPEKERVLSVQIDNQNLPASSSEPANKKTGAVDKDQPRSLSAGDGANLNDLAAGDTMVREPSSQYSRRLGLRTRKTVSHRDLVSAKPGRPELRPEQGETPTSRKIDINPPRNFVSASQKEVEAHPAKTQEIAALLSRRQKTKSLKGTVPQHRPLDVTSRSEDHRQLRSAEKMRIDPEKSAAALSAQQSPSTDLKRKSKLNMTVLGTPKTTTEPANDDLELASLSDNPSYWKGAMSVDRPKNSNSGLSNVKLQKRAVSLYTPVARIRKRALTRTLGRRASTGLKTNSVQKLVAVDDYRLDAAVPIALIDPVWNRVSSGAAVPLVDEPNELHHASDVVTSSNNAALNSRSQRVSFQGRHAGVTEEEPKRVNNLGSNVRSPSGVRANGNGNSQLRVKAATSNGDNGHRNQLRAQFGGTATSLHHESGDNGHIGSNQLRAKSGGATTSLHHENGDNGHIGAKSATSLHHRNGDNGHMGNNQVRVKLGGAASSSLQHRNGDNGHMELIKPQPRLHGSHVRNRNDVAAMVRSKLEEVGGLTEWLIGGGLGVFVDLFQERKIKEGDLPHLTMSSLKEIGVQAVGPRRKLIWMIEHLL